MAQTFHDRFPLSTLIFSCILPRPRDERWTGEKVKQINNALIKWCDEQGLLCLRTFGPFTKGGRARSEWFRDGLHLTWDKGLERLANFYKQQLSDKILMPRLLKVTTLRT